MENVTNKLNKKTLIFWLLFAIACAGAYHGLVKLFSHAYLQYGLRNNFHVIHFERYLLIPLVLISLFSGFVFYLYLSRSQINFNKRPSSLKFIFWFSIAIGLIPITTYLNNKLLEDIFEDKSMLEYLNNLDFAKIFDCLDWYSFGASWLTFLIVCLLFTYRK